MALNERAHRGRAEPEYARLGCAHGRAEIGPADRGPSPEGFADVCRIDMVSIEVVADGLGSGIVSGGFGHKCERSLQVVCVGGVGEENAAGHAALYNTSVAASA